MREQIIHVIEQKLTQALREADASTEEQARAAWSAIGPAPTCPSVGTVMKTIHHALAHGYRERGRVAKEVVVSTLTPIRTELTTRLVKEAMAVVVKAFPDDSFLALAQHTPGVYQRHLAPANKFEESVYSLELALMSVSAANFSRQSVVSIQTALDEMLLYESIANPAWWKRAPSALLKFVALPAVKWVFGIVAAVVIAALT